MVLRKTVYGDELKADVLMTANREYIEVYKFDSRGGACHAGSGS